MRWFGWFRKKKPPVITNVLHTQYLHGPSTLRVSSGPSRPSVHNDSPSGMSLTDVLLLDMLLNQPNPATNEQPSKVDSFEGFGGGTSGGGGAEASWQNDSTGTSYDNSSSNDNSSSYDSGSSSSDYSSGGGDSGGGGGDW